MGGKEGCTRGYTSVILLVTDTLGTVVFLINFFSCLENHSKNQDKTNLRSRSIL